MNVGYLKKILERVNDNSRVVIFVLSENNVYRPFSNISADVIDKGSFKEELHLDVSIFKEFRSIHFPNNLTEAEVEELLDKRNMLLEELEEVNKYLAEYVDE